MVTGGVEIDGKNKQTESDAIVQVLRDLNVPSCRLLFERVSTNTQENIEQARMTLQVAGLGDSIKTVIGVGHFTASRRFLMTMARRWPEVLTMFRGAYPPGVTKDNWHCHDDLRGKAKSEFDKIQPYLQKNFLCEIDLGALNNTVRARRTAPIRLTGPSPKPG